MPRLGHRLLRTAAKENPLLPLLLRPCRDLPSARRELQWLTEHAIKPPNFRGTRTRKEWWPILREYCQQRGQGKPLQYILGTEWFGSIELDCQPGVLIPRQETAASILYLVETITTRAHLQTGSNTLSVLDLCTGTGCIPLLIAQEFGQNPTSSSLKLGHVLGVDISRAACSLANQNRRNHLIRYQYKASLQQQELLKVSFVQADIMSEPKPPCTKYDFEHKPAIHVIDLWTELNKSGPGTEWDLLTCNPPYISPKHFYTTTSRSVRNFEPKLALVPPSLKHHLTDEQQGDLFYPRLLHLADKFKTKMLLMEVADLAQAERVAAMAQERDCWSGVEIWCDQPGMPWRESKLHSVPILGQGHGRSVFCWREMDMTWPDSSTKQAN